MFRSNSMMAEQIAQAAIACQTQRTGHPPAWISVVISENTLVVTLGAASLPTEEELPKCQAVAAQAQAFERQLFTDTLSLLLEEIRKITGVAVREASDQVQAESGMLVHVFTTGAFVQVFTLGQPLSVENWLACTSGDGSWT